MADSILTYATFVFFMTLFANNRVRSRFTLVVEFFVGWLVIELAWLNALLSGAMIVLVIFDLGDFSFSTVLGIALSGYNIFKFYQIHQQGNSTKNEYDKTLNIALGDNFKEELLEERRTLLKSDTERWKKPFNFSCVGVEKVSGITYGPNERNTLDLYKPTNSTNKPKPVMLQIHGGGWMLGFSDRQALPLKNKLVEAGWIFVSINYRLSPKHKMPAHIIDCKQALYWIKENIADYGGDPNFILTTGGSAGGHLCSLLTLTANKHQEILQPGFEKADLSVQGCLPMYGVYDFKDRNHHRDDLPLQEFLGDRIMPNHMNEDPELWDLVSPIAQSDDKRPPFMVTHGQLDTLAFVEDAKYFVKALRQDSEEPCVYTELEGTQHAFDIFYSPRCIHTVQALHTFCEYLYSKYLKTAA